MWRLWLIGFILLSVVSSPALAQSPYKAGGTVELSNDSISWTFSAWKGANTAAGPELLAGLTNDLYGTISEVRSTLDDRHSAFLLTGDVSVRPGDSGTPPTGIRALALPAVPDSQTQRTVSISVPQFLGNVWTSFRIYDRGACSFGLGWDTLTTELFRAFLGELADDPRIDDPAIEHAELRPILRSQPRVNFFSQEDPPPVDRDELQLNMQVSADRIERGGSVDSGRLIDTFILPGFCPAFVPACEVIGCNDVSVDISMTIRLRQTDFAWKKIKTKDYASRCGSAVADSWTLAFDNAIESGNAPECSGGPEALQEADAAHFLSTFNQRNDDDKHVLVGYSDVRGHDLGAHDILAEVTSVEVENFSGDNCPADFVRDDIQDNLRKSINRQLPLGLRNALQDTLSIDPALTHDLGDVACKPDKNQCGWGIGSLDGGFSEPVFQDSTAEPWAGARHDCRERRPGRLSDIIDNSTAQMVIADAISNASSNDSDGSAGTNDEIGDPLCHFQVEPDRLNLRPDGVELVFVDHILGDPQSPAFFKGEDQTDNIIKNMCRKHGLIPDIRQTAPPGTFEAPEDQIDVEPEIVQDSAPFTVDDLTTDDL